MPNLLNSFGRTKTWVDNAGKVLFESSIPGSYTYTFPRQTKCGVICVGGGAAGFSAKLGASAGGLTFTGLFPFSGGSGGYSYIEYSFNEGDVLTLIVGKGGTSYASTNVVGTISQSNPSYSPTIIEGTSSFVVLGGSTILSGGKATAGRFYFATPSDPNTLTITPSIGGVGTTTNGNNGIIEQNHNNMSLPGATSVYQGYGAGGSAGYNGDNQSGTPWANNGTNGYIKIFILSSDNA